MRHESKCSIKAIIVSWSMNLTPLWLANIAKTHYRRLITSQDERQAQGQRNKMNEFQRVAVLWVRPGLISCFRGPTKVHPPWDCTSVPFPKQNL